MSEPTFLSVFSGIGGIDYGLERSGWRCAGQIEIDDFCTRVLARHWPDVPRWRDVRSVGHAALTSTAGQQFTRQLDLLCGGFPCQDLSVAGRRAGLTGARSGLFFEFIRLARTLRPRWLLLENVPGLLSSHGGRDFATVLYYLGELGYGVSWRVLDSRHFGVAQRRRRVFLVGHLGSLCPYEVLFESPRRGRHSASSRKAGPDLARTLRGGPSSRSTSDDPDRTTYALTSRQTRLAAEDTFVVHNGQGDPNWDVDRSFSLDTQAPPAIAFNWQQGDDSKHGKDGRGRSWVARAGDYAGALSTTRHDAVAYGVSNQPTPNVSAGLMPALTAKERGGGRMEVVAFSENQRAEVLETGYSHALTAGGGKPGQGYPAVRLGSAVRRLTPTECERLQGFPDGFTCLCGVESYSIWTCTCPDSPRYAALGNAVTTTVAAWIGERIRSTQEAAG